MARPTKHNMSHSRLYRIWKNIKQRTGNPNNTEYRNYGGKGIVVCDEWLLFGEIDETISSRLGKAKRGDYGKKWQQALTPIAYAVDAVFRPIEGEWNHCTRHIEDDEGANEILLKKD